MLPLVVLNSLVQLWCCLTQVLLLHDWPLKQRCLPTKPGAGVRLMKKSASPFLLQLLRQQLVLQRSPLLIDALALAAALA